MDITVIRDVKDFKALKPEWNDITKNNDEKDFYLGFDWFIFLLDYERDPYEELYCITVREGEKLLGIVPGWLATKRLWVFKVRTLELIGNIYSPLRTAIIRKEYADAVMDRLNNYFFDKATREWDMINFENLSERDPFFRRMRTTADEKKLSMFTREQFVNMTADLTQFTNAEEYYRSLSQNLRGMIRKGIRKLQRAGRFEIVVFKDAEQDIDAAMKDYYTIYEKSWKQQELHSTFHLELAKMLAAQKKLRLFILYYREHENEDADDNKINNMPSAEQRKIQFAHSIPAGYIPIASFFALIYGDQAFFLKTAYHEDYARYSAGTVILWFVHQYLIDVDHVSCADHQQGDEGYKKRWSSAHEVRFQLMAAHVKSTKAKINMWVDRTIIPFLRKAKAVVVNKN